MNIAQSIFASQGVNCIVDKYISNVGCHAGAVIMITGYSSTACSPPDVNSGVYHSRGCQCPNPTTSQYNNSSTVANVNSNMSVAGGLAASSFPYMHVVYPFHNNIYS